MKLGTFAVRTPVGWFNRLGAFAGGRIIDLNFAYAWHAAGRGEPAPQALADAHVPATMQAWLHAGERARQAAADILTESRAAKAEWWKDDSPPRGPGDENLVYLPDEVRLLAPLPDPPSVRDFFAFEAHVKKGFEKRGEPMPQEWYEIPVYYRSGNRNIIGSGEDVRWPSFTQKFDYELELAAVIGRAGSNVPASQAHGYIAGYTVMNDFSARDIQRREMKVRLGPAKGKEWCTALGPWLVTADEVGNPYQLEMTARVNGVEWSRGNSSSIHWKFEQMIEFLTRDDRIEPGDVIGSGTVGTGCGLELDRWVQRGDVMELQIEKIGVLRNRVV